MFAGGPKNYSYATGPTVSFSGQASLGRLGLSRFRFRLWPGFFRGRDVDGLLAGGHGGGHIGWVDFYLVHRQVSVHRHCSVDRTRKFLAHTAHHSLIATKTAHLLWDLGPHLYHTVP